MIDFFALTKMYLKDSLGMRFEKFMEELEKMPIYQIPMLLREEGFNAEICEIAYYESLKAFMTQEDQGQNKILPAGIAINSSLQWLEISASAQSLGKVPGIYALWKNENNLHEISLTKNQAKILDQLLDDLLPNFSEEERHEIKNLQQLGILI